MAYEYIPFPRWKYSTTGKRLVQSAEEEAALGDGWYSSPADVPKSHGARLLEAVAPQLKALEPMSDEEAQAVVDDAVAHGSEVVVKRPRGRPRRLNGNG